MKYRKSPVLEEVAPPPSLRDKIRRLGFLFLFYLSVPGVGLFFSLFDARISEMLDLLYLGLFHFIPLLWFTVALPEYGRTPRDEKNSPEALYPPIFSNAWQLLLFPVHISTGEHQAAKRLFTKAGFRIWEGWIACLFCALALKPDMLDGFDPDWGIPLSYQEIMLQFRLSFTWDLLLGLVLFVTAREGWGTLFLGLAILQGGAMIYFFSMENWRMRGIRLEGLDS